MKHIELCQLSVKYLKRCGVPLILQEFVSGASEQPDVLGFKTGFSIMIECKVSRNDFKNDAKKYHRRKPNIAMGNYRFYACPTGLIKLDEIPEGWGLLYFSEDFKLEVVKGPKSNIFSQELTFFDANDRAEKIMLISTLRRVNKEELKDKNYKVFIRDDKC